MRVGIDVSKALGAARDGLASYARHLTRALLEEGSEHELVLYSLLEETSPEALAEHFPAPNARPAGRSGLAPVGGEVDLFHATAYLAPPACAAPLVMTLYDLTFLTHPQHHTLANRVHCLRGAVAAACRARRVIAISEHTRRQVVEQLGIPRQRVAVIHPAVSEAFRPLDRAAARRYVAARFGVEGPYVLSVGTLEPRKNLARLVEAYAALPPEVAETAPLVLAGGHGWLNAELRALIEDLGHGRRVHLLGQVEDADLPSLYCAARLFAYPSLAEGFGLPPLEAMACGTAVLTSNATSLPEVVGEAAVTVDPRDTGALSRALAALLGDEGRRRELEARGPERARRFSWRRSARRTLDLYAEVLAEVAGEGGAGAAGESS